MNWPVVGWPTQTEFRPSAYPNYSPRSDNMRAALGWPGEPQPNTGLRWTPRKSASDQSYAQVAWSPQLRRLVAISAGGGSIPVYSDNGFTWRLVSNTFLTGGGPNHGIAWSPELGIFCAIGSVGSYTSRDGIEWQSSGTVSGINSIGFNGMCWSSEQRLFVAVGSGPIGNFVVTSPDGQTWTTRAITGLTGSLDSVVWAKEIGVFCAANDSSGGAFVTSANGATWTVRSVPQPGNWYGLCWSPYLQLFCAVSNGGANRAMTSPDGATWTLQTCPQLSWIHVAWSEHLRLFCAVGSGGAVMTSPNGRDWTLRPAVNNTFTSVIYLPELRLFCAAGFSGTGNRIMTSP